MPCYPHDMALKYWVSYAVCLYIVCFKWYRQTWPAHYAFRRMKTSSSLLYLTKKANCSLFGVQLSASSLPTAHGCSLCGAVIRLFSPQLVSAGQATNPLPGDKCIVVQWSDTWHQTTWTMAIPWIGRICTLGNIRNTGLHLCEIWGLSFLLNGACGGAAVEALRYKSEGCEIDSRWCHWNFSLT
jgi:hypothetical protein